MYESGFNKNLSLKEKFFGLNWGYILTYTFCCFILFDAFFGTW